jgi:hypothetical protein
MLFVAAETSCPTCRSVLFVQRLDGDAFCQACGHERALPPRFGAHAVAAVVAAGRGMTEGEATVLSVDGVTLRVRRGRPACPSCGAAHGGGDFCTACGYPLAPRRVGGATIRGEAKPAHAPTSGERGVDAFGCRQCGAPMSLSGMPQTVECEFCHTINHVPRAFYYRGHVATERRLVIEPDEALAERSATMPVELLARVSVARPAWPFFHQPDGSAVLVTDDVIFAVDPALNLKWARHAVNAREFPGPDLNPRRFLTGPGVLSWAEGKELRSLDVTTGNERAPIPFPEIWRELFRHPSVLFADGGVYVKGKTAFRWSGDRFVQDASFKAFGGADHVRCAGDEIWIARAEPKGVVMTRHGPDLTPRSRARAPAIPESAHWSFAFWGDVCALTVGGGVSVGRGEDAKPKELFRLGKSRPKLMQMGELGLAFLHPGGKVETFDLEGKPRMVAAAPKMG